MRALGERPVGDCGAFDLRRLEWFDLRNMLLVARAVAMAAVARSESRGAHQREDFPEMLPAWQFNQLARLGRARHHARQDRRDARSGAMRAIAKLKIWRGTASATGRWTTYEVPFEPGQSVLDGLRWIRANVDSGLAIRFSCINANACKECMMELDGKTVYACTARLEPREMILRPSPTSGSCVISSPRSPRPQNGC